MTTYASFKGASSAMTPSVPSSVPVGATFIDSTNSNALSFKSVGGSVTVIGESSSSDIMVKLKKNLTGYAIASGKTVALKPDGSIVLADNDGSNTQVVLGVTMESIANDTYGRVMLNGANVPGAVTGLTFTSGQAILLSSTPGVLTNTAAGLDPATMTIMKVGIADCASGVCSGTATDLIMEAEVISRPGGGM